MDNEKKGNVQKPEEIRELTDEQMESVAGGLAVPTIGPVNLTNLETGQALPEDTGFKPQRPTNPAGSIAGRRSKI